MRQQTTFDNTKDSYYLNNTRESHSGNPETLLSAAEINAHIENLEDGFRIPFQMYQEGYKYKEIAEEMNLNIGTVKSRIFFGRKKLMEQIERN